MARELLGAVVISRLGGVEVRGMITETEAYLGHDDPASHAYRGRRHPGNLGVYSPPAHWYVYRSYGIHWCANLVTGSPAPGGAVLLRAAVLCDGLEAARRRRNQVADSQLGNGPGKLCQALGIDRSLDGTAMRSSPVTVLPGTADHPVAVTPRIGITKAADWPLRFVIVNDKRGRP